MTSEIREYKGEW